MIDSPHRLVTARPRPEADRVPASSVRSIRFAIRLAAPLLAIAALAGCSTAYNCSGGNYRGGCAAGPDVPETPAYTPPAYTPPAYAAPAAVPPTAAPPGPGTVPVGDPAQFADIDDKQCRSYGLTFGSHEYADCRIRLSAQHRGLDPNIGAAPR